MAAYDQKGQFERVTREVLPALKAAFAGETDHALRPRRDRRRRSGPCHRDLQCSGLRGLSRRPHEHRGTHNALIRFGADYIELLGVYDPETAVEVDSTGERSPSSWRIREGGLVGHCYATDDIEEEAARMREAGLEMVGPSR